MPATNLSPHNPSQHTTDRTRFTLLGLLSGRFGESPDPDCPIGIPHDSTRTLALQHAALSDPTTVRCDKHPVEGPGRTNNDQTTNKDKHEEGNAKVRKEQRREIKRHGSTGIGGNERDGLLARGLPEAGDATDRVT